MTDLPPDDQPGDGLGFVPVPADVAAAAFPAEPDLRHPLFVADAFLSSALEDPEHWHNLLLRLTTPESHEAWGDFRDVGDSLAGHMLATGVHEAHEPDGTPAPDVVYINLVQMQGMGDFAYVADGEMVVDSLPMTLVWRPEFGSWCVHRIGPPAPPEELPRTSPGEAPDWRSLP